MDLNKVISTIDNLVWDFLNKNKNLIPFHIYGNEQNLSHVITTSRNILLSKNKINIINDDFVNNFLDNNLYGTLFNADYINKECLSFYVQITQKIEIPKNLLYE